MADPDGGKRRILRLAGVAGIPEVTPGADLVALIGDAIESDAPLGSDDGVLHDGDILVVTSKIVSKAEGRIIRAENREEAITAETVRLVARREHPGGVTRIVENRQGLVLAAAGVDASNTDEGTVLLLPEHPDASARALASGLRERFGRRIGVIVSDTLGRPWREGQTDAAIGAAGVRVLDDLRGSADSFGRQLAVTMAATADELAAASDLVKGKASGMPVAVVRGMSDVVTDELDTPARALVRTGPTDMFRLGTDEALAEGRREGLREAERQPALRSVVFRDLPRPQLVYVTTVALPTGASTDPAVWAREIFARRSAPTWVREGDEVLVPARPARAGLLVVLSAVGVDVGVRVVRVTTAVSARHARAHPVLDVCGAIHHTRIRGLLARAARRLSATEGA